MAGSEVEASQADRDRHGVRGTALLTVLGAILLLAAIGLALGGLSMSETLATGNLRRARAALSAAEAGLERALPDLLAAADWNAVLDGRVRSSFIDGGTGPVRVLDDGRVIDLDRILNLANCARGTPCSAASTDAATEERPWGRNNPRWRLFAHGPLDALSPDGPETTTGLYVVVLVGDDPSENDDDPLRDGSDSSNPGAGVLVLRAEAFGPELAHRVIEAVVARGVPIPGREGYPAQRGSPRPTGQVDSPPVQSPGGELTQMELSIATGGMRCP